MRLIHALRDQSGSVAVVVTLMLGVLIGAFGLTVAVAGYSDAETSTQGSADSLALEAARLCQAQGTTCNTTTVNTQLASLAAANRVSIESVSTSSVVAADMPGTTAAAVTKMNRSKVVVSISRTWTIPFLNFFTAAPSKKVTKNSTASWSNSYTTSTQDTLTSKAVYLPLMVSSCLASQLTGTSDASVTVTDNKLCSGSSTVPQGWYFGAAANCTTTPTKALKVGDSQTNRSTLVTATTCASGDYWVPVYTNYNSSVPGTSAYRAKWKWVDSKGKIVNFLADCPTTSTSWSSSCTINSVVTGTLPSSLSALSQKTEFMNWVDATGKLVDKPVQISGGTGTEANGVVAKFIKVKVTNLNTSTKTFTLQFAGQDIKLLPTWVN